MQTPFFTEVTSEKNNSCKDLPLPLLLGGDALLRVVSWNSDQNKGRVCQLLYDQ